MKAFNRIVLAILVVIALLALVAFLLPASVHVERSVAVNAPPAKVFPYLNSLKQFNLWSPWYIKDPDAEYRFTGPDSGVGATMTWTSDSPEVGNGSQEIVASEPPRRVRTALDFGAQGAATAEWLVAPEGDGSVVTWTLDVKFEGSVFQRYFGLAMDGMVGRDYEAGLARLKALVETGSPAG